METIWDTSTGILSGTGDIPLGTSGHILHKSQDGQQDAVLNNIVNLAATICNASASVISLLSQGELHIRAFCGIRGNNTELVNGFYYQTLLAEDVFIVSDTSTSSLFPANTPYNFYAGIRLMSQSGAVLGTMLVLDKTTRPFTQAQIKSLRRLAQLAASHIETLYSRHEQQREEQLQQLIMDNALGYAIITTSLSGEITSWNTGAERLFGWHEAEILNNPIDIVFTPEERRRKVPEARRLSALHHRQDPVERWHVRKDRTQFWASGQLLPLYDNDGHAQGFLKILIDRTHAREQQERLREQEEMLRLSQEAGGIGAFDLNLLTQELTITDQTRNIFGIPPDLVVTTDLMQQLVIADNATDFYQSNDPSLSDIKETLLNPKTYQEYRIRRHDNDEECWVARSTQIIIDADNKPIRTRGVIQDITARKRAEEQQALLTAELAHRSKNILAVIQGIANQTLRATTTPEEARTAFEARIMALSKAQDVLTHGANSATAQLSEIVENSLSVHAGADKNRIHIEGPCVTLGSKQALAMVMALHELGTNAVKYGAFSTASGHITIRWTFENGRFLFKWVESGGPQVDKPTRRGFGSRLIERTLAASLGGTAELHYHPEGFDFHLDAPASMQH